MLKSPFRVYLNSPTQSSSLPYLPSLSCHPDARLPRSLVRCSLVASHVRSRLPRSTGTHKPPHLTRSTSSTQKHPHPHHTTPTITITIKHNRFNALHHLPSLYNVRRHGEDTTATKFAQA
jgi:hypothetical protein